MKAIKFMSAISAAFLLTAGSVNAQDTDENIGDEGELTMTLIPDANANLPEAVTRMIELPESASNEGRTNSAGGLETANDARTRRQAGLETANDARERGREFGADMAEAAQSNRENVGRGAMPDRPNFPDLPNLPGSVPDSVPDRPEGPNPPNPPGRPGG
jgi:hypothetical protein